MTKQNRILYLEKIRVLALFFVLYTHSGNACAFYFEQASTKLGYWISLLMFPIFQCCVCLFFMISGALLLKRQESLKKLYLHRVLPMTIVTALFVLIQYIQNCFDYGMTFSALDYLKALYSGGAITEHWFLYSYFSFLIFLPFLRELVKGLQKAHYYYLFILMIGVNTIFPMWEAVSDWKQVGISIPFLVNIYFYPLMGYYFENSKDALLEKRKILILADLAGLFLAIMNCFMNYHSLTVGGVIAYRTSFLPFFTCLVFWNMKVFCSGEKHEKLWQFLGSGVFGTYLLEPQLQHLFAPVKEYFMTLPAPYLANIFLLVCMGLTGILAVNLLKKIPIIKMLL